MGATAQLPPDQVARLLDSHPLKIEIEVLFFTVYRYQQTRDEVWRNGKLIALASTADDDGTPHNIYGEAGPDGIIEVTSGKDSWTLPAESVPASYWNVSMVTCSPAPATCWLITATRAATKTAMAR